MKIKNILLALICVFVGQSVMAASLTVKNQCDVEIEVTVTWEGGEKTNFIKPNNTKYVDSFGKRIIKISWIEDRPYNKKPSFSSTLSIGPFSLFNTLIIKDDGVYKYNDQPEIRTVLQRVFN